MTHYQDNPQITHSLIDGMGALAEPQYFWWEDVVADHSLHGDETVPADWMLRVQSANPHDPNGGNEGNKFPPFGTEIRHETVVKALDGILAGKFSDDGTLASHVHAVSPTTVEHCQKLVDDPEYGYLSWDAWVSDELLQVIVYGGIAF